MNDDERNKLMMRMAEDVAETKAQVAEIRAFLMVMIVLVFGIPLVVGVWAAAGS